MNNIIKNISYSFLANIVSIIISIVMVIFLPKMLSIKDYGLWQLYLFYTSYLGFFHFGWLDGIYLRYGGLYFEQLNKSVFSSQLVALCTFEIVLAVIGYILTCTIDADKDIATVLQFACIVLVPVILYTFSSFLLQITNKIKEYAQLLLLERLLFFLLVCVCLLSGYNYFNYIITADLCAKFLICFYGLYVIKNIITTRIDKLAQVWQEIKNNISVGSKLLIANIAGLLIIGIIRFAISYHWDISDFGKVSLSLSIANFFMIFINSLSIVMFPVLKRLNEDKQKELYFKLRNLLTAVLLCAFICYYPIKYILLLWIPKYKDALIYINILFPVFLFESRIMLLVNTYFKALRYENTMLRCNLCIVLLGIIMAGIGIWVDELKIMVLFITILSASKNLLAEYLLSKSLKIKLLKPWLSEISVVTAFIILNYFLHDEFIAFLNYLVIIIIYLVCNKRKIKGAVSLKG